MTDEQLAELRKRFEAVALFPQHDPDGWRKMLDLRNTVERILLDHPKPLTLSGRIMQAYNDMDDEGMDAALEEVNELEARVKGLEK